VTHYRLEYSKRYFRRLEDIHELIAEDNPAAAGRTVERIRIAVERLITSPAIGRPGRVADTRELVIAGTPYIVPYRVKDDAAQIITVLHSSQRWPDAFPG
jgi:toxin ParE1/3/4